MTREKKTQNATLPHPRSEPSSDFQLLQRSDSYLFPGPKPTNKKEMLTLFTISCSGTIGWFIQGEKGKIKREFEKEKIPWRTTIYSLTSISLYAVVY